jgi:hypothetical protein
MMGLSFAEADSLSLYDYEELLYHWNEAHDTDGDVEPPDPEVAMRILDKINATPELIH